MDRKDHNPHPIYPWLLVSTCGEVVSCRIGKRAKIVGQRLTHRGYLIVCAWDGVKNKVLSVARAILGAHVGMANNMEASHLNGKRTDNRLENLAWETSAQNQGRRADHGTLAIGDRNASAKIKNTDIPEIWKLHYSGESYAAIGKRLGVDFQLIGRVIRGRTWAAVSRSFGFPLGDTPAGEGRGK